jgi:hypothetical protein
MKPDCYGSVRMSPLNPPADSATGDATDGLRVAVKIAVVESAASWVVRRVLESGYRRATGHRPPTARDQGVPLRRILIWASLSAAAVAVANVVADRVVLRHEPTTSGKGPP